MKGSVEIRKKAKTKTNKTKNSVTKRLKRYAGHKPVFCNVF